MEGCDQVSCERDENSAEFIADCKDAASKSSEEIHKVKQPSCCRKENDDHTVIGQFGDPVFKKLAVLNGAVNRMTKDEIKAKLGQLHLDTRGHKDVMKKRLKNFYKQKHLTRSSSKTSPKKPHYNYYVIIDFEATCDQNAVRYPHEIIEFPAVLINAADGSVVDEFHSFVRPTQNPCLSEYCKQLTSITQEQVDSAPTFVEVLRLMEEWMIHHRLGCGKKFAVVTDGPWDMSRFMYLQCRTSRVPFPRWAMRWVNLRKSYCNSYKVARINVKTMLEYLGLSFEGRQHRGSDDARNIARIVTHMINDGCNVYVNEKMFESKLASVAAAAVSAEIDPEVVCVREDEANDDDDDDDDAEEEDADAGCRHDNTNVGALLTVVDKESATSVDGNANSGAGVAEDMERAEQGVMNGMQRLTVLSQT